MIERKERDRGEDDMSRGNRRGEKGVIDRKGENDDKEDKDKMEDKIWEWELLYNGRIDNE